MSGGVSMRIWTLIVLLTLGIPTLSLSPYLSLIVPSDVEADALFGKSLSVVGDVMAVGAPGDNTEGFNAGAVYVFLQLSGVWSQQSMLTGATTVTQDKFGTSVSIYDDTLIVGAVNKNRVISATSQVQAGTVYVFWRVGNAWSENQMLVASDGQAYDHFGISVSVYENAIIIGAADDNLDDDTSSGSVYLFTRSSPSGSFTQKDNKHSNDADDGDKFGFSVDLYGDVAVVGAYQDDDQGSRSGSVYVYDVSGNAFAFEQKITAFDSSSDNAQDAFGYSLSLYDDQLAISSFFDDDISSASGAVYVYSRASDTVPWTAQAKLSNSDAGVNEYFGYAVDLYMNEMVVGAIGSNSNAGMAFVFQKSGATWVKKFDIVVEGQQSNDELGFAVAIYDTHIAVTSPEHDYNGQYDSGTVYYGLNVDSPTSQPSSSHAPSLQPSGYPSAMPSSSSPSRQPITSSPTQQPVTSTPTCFPSVIPTVIPTSLPSVAPKFVEERSDSLSSESNMIAFMFVIVAILCGAAVTGYLIYYFYGSVKKSWNARTDTRMSPVLADIEVVNASVTTPRNELTIASVIAIEEVTPSPRKKRSKSSSSVTPVLPFATHVGDYIPVAERRESMGDIV